MLSNYLLRIPIDKINGLFDVLVSICVLFIHKFKRARLFPPYLVSLGVFNCSDIQPASYSCIRHLSLSTVSYS